MYVHVHTDYVPVLLLFQKVSLALQPTGCKALRSHLRSCRGLSQQIQGIRHFQPCCCAMTPYTGYLRYRSSAPKPEQPACMFSHVKGLEPCIYMYIHAYIFNAFRQAHIHIHAHVHVPVPVQIHTYMYIYIYIYECGQPPYDMQTPSKHCKMQCETCFFVDRISAHFRMQHAYRIARKEKRKVPESRNPKS